MSSAKIARKKRTYRLREVRRKRLIRAVSGLVRIAASRGASTGYRLGNGSGYRVGYLNGMIQRYLSQPVTKRDLHIMYVMSGMGLVYEAMDAVIARSLEKAVRQLTVVHPSMDVWAAAAEQRPDAVIVLNGYVNVEQVRRIRELGIPTAIWKSEDPYYTDDMKDWIDCYDHIFTLELSCVDFYRQGGCPNVHYLPFANDFSMFRPQHVPPDKQFDVLFVGNGFWNRIRFFDQIANYLAGKHVRIIGGWWERLSRYNVLAPKIVGHWMLSAETAQYYSGAKIVINLHRDFNDDTINANNAGVPAYSPNPRTFEIAGSGALLLSDIRLDIPNQYVPGKEIATYSTPAELMNSIEYYLNHEQERQQIASSGVRRTAADHNYDKRIGTMLDALFPAT